MGLGGGGDSDKYSMGKKPEKRDTLGFLKKSEEEKKRREEEKKNALNKKDEAYK
jgi:hypothetical protein